MKKGNFFEDMMEQDSKKETKEGKTAVKAVTSKKTFKPVVEKKVEKKVEVKEAPIKKEVKKVTRERTMVKPRHSTAENSKTYLFRTTPEFFNQLKMFGNLTHQSLNNIVESALLEYLDRPENRNNAKHAEEMARHL
ncbi:MAG: hypothetical protein MJ214_05705 [Bacilli bacterium]|nr:hypothetical protein [Bacilli bacterium]